MSIFKKRPAPSEPVITLTERFYLPISPSVAKADLEKLRGLAEEDETLAAVLRLLTELHGTCVYAAEQAVRVSDAPHTPAVADRYADADAAIDAVKSAFANVMLLDTKQLHAVCDWLFAPAEGGAE